MLNYNFEELETLLKSHDFSIVGKIGSGRSCDCYKIYSNKYKDYFACKVLPLNDMNSQKNTRHFQKEFDTLCHIIHPNIIQTYKTIITPKFDILILDYCPNGDLQRFVERNGPITNKKNLFTLLSKILKALTYLENEGIAHHDLKPSNILLDKYNRPKLCDFGSARNDVRSDQLSKDFVGTLIFEAPEIIAKKPFNPILADVWSFGVTTYFLATSQFPFPCDNFANLKVAVEANNFYIPPNMDNTLKTIIKNSLVHTPEKRMSFHQLSKIVDQALLQETVKAPSSSLPKILPIRNLSGVAVLPNQSPIILRPRQPRRYSSVVNLLI